MAGPLKPGEKPRGARSWGPGQSGNPGGRPSLKNARAIIEELTGESARTLYEMVVAVALDPPAKQEKRFGFAATFADRLAAARVLLERGWGAPRQVLSTSQPQPLRVIIDPPPFERDVTPR